jgi:hypothetical protein
MVNIKKNIEDNFIWRDPMDSEEAKQMSEEANMSRAWKRNLLQNQSP